MQVTIEASADRLFKVNKQTDDNEKGQPSISIAPVIDSWILLLHVPRLTILN